LAADERYAENHARVRNRDALVAILAERIGVFPRDELLAALEKAGVPAGPINTLGDVFAEPQVIHRRMRLDVTAADGTRIPGVRTPIVMAESPLAYGVAAPRLGEHAT
jgi:crotonobetainyl-CoA:carnitine CoA-transferase CaiB-like acyl-CoA transferase